MKKLIVSVKPTSQALEDFKKTLKSARAGKLKKTHLEVSFDNRKDFERFVGNLHVLQSIRTLKPTSIYDLSKKTGLDVSNLNKLVRFFEALGVIEVVESVADGRKVKSPRVSYDKIEFDLVA